jgi:cytochrome d ubiquinol oxidase subunit I
MTVLLDRWQFAVTIIYHFLFVPLTIGLGLLVAIMQTMAYRRHDDDWDRLSRFFGKLFLINFAMGLVTGIVQEFQFGMNWSTYSIFVGNIFGAPLAIEGLVAFFMESTFLGLWIFGRGRISPRLHLATIWLVALGTTMSALFILAANAWMQHPVGYKIVHHQAVLTSFRALFANSTLWGEFTHTVLAAYVTGAMVVLGVSAWQLLKGRDPAAFRRAARLAAIFGLVALLATGIAGDSQARLNETQQPMKLAAAEALYHTKDGASFSILTIGNLSGQPVFQIRIPHLLSLISDLSWNGTVVGIDNAQAAEAHEYGKGSYVPVIWLSYWSFRLMMGFGFVMAGVLGWTLVLDWRRRLAQARWFLWVTVAAIVTPFAANTFGWLFTETGRQPWIVWGLMKTAAASSPNVGEGSVIATLAGFAVLYTVLGVIDAILMSRAARTSLGPPGRDRGASGDAAAPEGGHGNEVGGLVY